MATITILSVPEISKFKKGGFMGIQKSHRGWCTPLSNPHCTGHRRALALTLKKHHGFHADGGVAGLPQYAAGGTDWGNIASQVGEYAPTLFNLYQGMKSPEQLNTNQFVNNKTLPYRDLDMTPVMQGIDQERNLAAQQAKVGTGSGNYLSNLQNLSANSMTAKSNAIMEGQKFNIAGRNAADQFNSQLNTSNLGNRLNVEQYNAGNRAKQSQYLGAASEGIQKHLYTKDIIKNQKNNDLLGTNILSDIYSNFGYDGLKEYVNTGKVTDTTGKVIFKK